MRDGSVQVGEELVQRRFEHREDLGVRVEALLDRRTEVIGRSTPAERDTVVVRSLAVDDEVSVVGEGLVLREAHFVPEALGQRLGGDHQRVDRRHGASFARQRRREGLGGAHDEVRVHAGADGDDLGLATATTGDDAHDRRLFVDLDAEPFDGVTETAHQTGGVDASAVRRELRPDGTVEVAVGREGIALEPVEVLGPDAALA